ncbi:MAG: phosphatase PAP2 family protein [Candidatus Weimeria sp.]
MEIEFLDFIQNHMRSDVMDAVMVFFTRLGNGGFIWIVFTLVMLFNPKTRKTGFAMALALIVDAVACNLVLKPLVARARPFEVNTAVTLLIKKPLDYSFPSGHTSASFAVAAALFFSGKKLWIPACVLASIISFSRLYLYVHYPTDVLAGLLIGIMAGFLGSRLQRLISGRMHEDSEKAYQP